jgi:hypothetical protein
MSKSGAWVIAIALATSGCDCGGDDVAPGDGGRRDTGAIPDTGPRADTGPGCVTALPVDMLWVIDNSNSMMEEQNNLAINFRELIDVLTAPPDSDMDGVPDYPPVDDLRIGVVSTDLGIGPHMGVVNCDAMGDDAQLVTMSRSADPACMGVTTGADPWLSFHAGDDAMAFSQQFSCMARLGTTGCGLEQQLEASLRGVTESGGFVRADSLLAIVLVTDEEDCSAADDRIFDPSMDAELGTYRTRCADHPELLHPVDRYATQLAAFRLDRAGDVVFAAITGVPRDLVDVPDLIDYEEILADPRMQYTRDPMDSTALAPACETPGIGSAIPARRIVQVVQRFAATEDGIVQSICSGDLRPAIRAVASLVARRICPPII